jgi:hypothetical protein
MQVDWGPRFWFVELPAVMLVGWVIEKWAAKHWNELLTAIRKGRIHE